MKNPSVQYWIRMIVALCGVLLIVILFVPMWHIDLDAPQYPEGLQLLITPYGLEGNVDIINGLNHYIGMKTLHSEDFIEFTILPYIIVFFAVFCFVAAATGNRKVFYTLSISFVLFGIISMIDFWRWEYDYGHNLNPNAAIVVPGMAYQPPLIGFKQLLNFGAYSIPDVGGWLFLGVGATLFMCLIMHIRLGMKIKKNDSLKALTTFSLLMLFFVSCTVSPNPIKVGVDNCQFCKMTISDERFGAEIITQKGKIMKFDEAHCLLSYIKTNAITNTDIKDIYLTDYCLPHSLVNNKNSFLFKSDELRSPMGGNVAAFAHADSMNYYLQKFNGEEINWAQLISENK